MNSFKRRLALATFLLGFSGVSHAHDAVADLGGPANFVGMAEVDCFPDNIEFSGEDTDHLLVQIRDNSPAIDGVSVSVHIFRNRLLVPMLNIATDPISGDAGWSPTVIARGGNGKYTIIVSKTGEGERNFELIYHCIAKDGFTHTGTGIYIQQFGSPQVEPR